MDSGDIESIHAGMRNDRAAKLVKQFIRAWHANHGDGELDLLATFVDAFTDLALEIGRQHPDVDACDVMRIASGHVEVERDNYGADD